MPPSSCTHSSPALHCDDCTLSASGFFGSQHQSFFWSLSDLCFSFKGCQSRSGRFGCADLSPALAYLLFTISSPAAPTPQHIKASDHELKMQLHLKMMHTPYPFIRAKMVHIMRMGWLFLYALPRGITLAPMQLPEGTASTSVHPPADWPGTDHHWRQICHRNQRLVLHRGDLPFPTPSPIMLLPDNL